MLHRASTCALIQLANHKKALMKNARRLCGNKIGKLGHKSRRKTKTFDHYSDFQAMNPTVGNSKEQTYSIRNDSKIGSLQTSSSHDNVSTSYSSYYKAMKYPFAPFMYKQSFLCKIPDMSNTKPYSSVFCRA